MLSPTVFRSGKSILIDQVVYRVEGHADDRKLLLRHVDSGAIRIESVQGLLSMYMRGQLCLTDARSTAAAQGARAKDIPRADKMTLAARTNTDRKLAYVTRLEELGVVGASQSEVTKATSQVANERGEPCAPHFTTVYRWIRQFQQHDVSGLLSRIGSRGGRRASRLDAEVNRLLVEKIEEALERARKWSAEDIQDSTRFEVELRNKTRVGTNQLAVPSLRTIQRRLAALPQYDVAVAKLGVTEAERRYVNMCGARRISRILQLAEIDHTPLDLLVVDERRVAIGRPMLTLVLDRLSRCILGFHLSLDGYGTHSVFAALRHALLPKTYLDDEKYADMQLDWPCFGWFEQLVMDNGREFHANSVVDALLNIGIIAEFARSKQPNDKPHVERVLKTINYSFVHKLPGTTFAKQHERIGFKSEDEAALTLEEVDAALHVWITQKYHRRPHQGLRGKTPQQVWEESAKLYPPQLKCNVDDVDIEFSESRSSALQHYGIDLNNFRYSSPELMGLRRLLPAGAKVDVKWARRDVGHIYVWDPTENHFIKVMNVHSEFAGLSIEQAKAVLKQRAKDSPEDRAVRSSAAAAVKDIVDTAMADKALKVRRKGARVAGQNSQVTRGGGTARQGVADGVIRSAVRAEDDDGLQPFEVLTLEAS